jgi:hypothetical protein
MSVIGQSGSENREADDVEALIIVVANGVPSTEHISKRTKSGTERIYHR